MCFKDVFFTQRMKRLWRRLTTLLLHASSCCASLAFRGSGARVMLWVSYHDPNVSPGGMTILPAFRTPDGHQNGFWWKCVAHCCIFYPATATHSPHLSHTSVRTFSTAGASGLSVVQSNGYMLDGMSFTWTQGGVSVAEKYMSTVLVMEAGDGSGLSRQSLASHGGDWPPFRGRDCHLSSVRYCWRRGWQNRPTPVSLQTALEEIW